MTPSSPLGIAVIGYGPTFNFGWMHAKWIQGVSDLKLLGICDKDPDRAALAETDFPGVEVFTDLDQLLAREDIGIVSVVTQHNTHLPLVIKCLEAGKHTVVEKPMCMNTAEATQMVDTAERVGKTLAVYHNRRHDGNVRRIKDLIAQGELGEVFHIELSSCGYGPPGDVWRSKKEVCGGLLYDWGSHAIDWVLSTIPSPMAQITGFFHKLLWHDCSNEDQARAVIRFENGCVADIQQSSIAYAGKPLWRILGTKGAIVDSGAGAIDGYCKELVGPSGGSLKLINATGEHDIPYMESDWVTYYKDLADHFISGAKVPVSGVEGRRVITVLETAEKSSKEGKSLTPPFA